MPGLQRLRADHASALLAFELENRRYFAGSIPDRGDAYFAEFHDRHRILLDEQEAGLLHFHVIVAQSGAVIGRVNLVDVAGGSAELGYRIAELAAGKGIGTAAVAQVCELAASNYGLASLRAVTSADNLTSQRVLTRNGFVHRDDIPVEGGRPDLMFTRDLAKA